MAVPATWAAFLGGVADGCSSQTQHFTGLLSINPGWVGLESSHNLPGTRQHAARLMLPSEPEWRMQYQGSPWRCCVCISGPLYPCYLMWSSHRQGLGDNRNSGDVLNPHSVSPEGHALFRCIVCSGPHRWTLTMYSGVPGIVPNPSSNLPFMSSPLFISL